jgi:hypothetical protein
MSVRTGDRATYRGHSVIVNGPAPAIDGPRWDVLWKNGKASSGWTHDIAEESALSGVTRPSWEIGAAVKVGFSPIRESGTIAGVTTDDGGDLVYSVTIPADDNRRTEEGVRWTRDAYTLEAKANVLDTHT